MLPEKTPSDNKTILHPVHALADLQIGICHFWGTNLGNKERGVSCDELLLRRLVRFNPQRIGENPALLRGKLPLVLTGIQDGAALIRRNGTQISKSVLHHRLPLRRQRGPFAQRTRNLHPVHRRQPLQVFHAGQTALPLLVCQPVHVVQLLHKALLLGVREALEAGVVAQNLFLILHWNILMLVQP